MKVRRTQEKDLIEVMEIYDRARKFMAETGNPFQWGTQYPAEDLIRSDIRRGVSQVCEGENGIEAVFAFVLGEDPTYLHIEDGAWLNDRPYGTIHRIAGRGTQKGIASVCLDWCCKKCGNLRADTHADNAIMQKVLEKNGFQKCGRIYVADGSARIAYHRADSVK